jgi:hypothetical protein
VVETPGDLDPAVRKSLIEGETVPGAIGYFAVKVAQKD